MKFLKPRALKKGDTVAVIAPSWGGAAKFPHIYRNAVKVLEQDFGLKVKEYPTVQCSPDALHKSPEMRAKDVNQAFKDKDVKAIFVTIGGDDSIRILPFLDKLLIKKNPKIFMGFSDTTNLTTFINQAGLVSFNGPSMMAGISQSRNFDGLAQHMKDILFSSSKIYEYKQFSKWTDGYPDWRDEKNTGKVNEFRQNSGWRLLQGNKAVEGRLFGGCIEILVMLNGTAFWPKKSFWKDVILFIETSEEKPTPNYVKYALRNLGMQGILKSLKGILVGRPAGYSDEEKLKLDKAVLEVVRDEFGRNDMPIITNMDFGHTDPQIILPLGVKARIDCQSKRLSLVESPVA